MDGVLIISTLRLSIEASLADYTTNGGDMLATGRMIQEGTHEAEQEGHENASRFWLHQLRSCKKCGSKGAWRRMEVESQVVFADEAAANRAGSSSCPRRHATRPCLYMRAQCWCEKNDLTHDGAVGIPLRRIVVEDRALESPAQDRS